MFASKALASIPDDTNSLLTLTALVDVAATLDHCDAAAALMELPRPHAGRRVVLNQFGGGGSYRQMIERAAPPVLERIGQRTESAIDRRLVREGPPAQVSPTRSAPRRMRA